MTSAALTHRQRLRRGVAAAGLAACLGLAACGGPAEPGAAPSTASPSPSSPDTPAAPPSADQVVIDITIADGQVKPNGAKVAVSVGQQVVLHVSSDQDDEIHAHTDSADGYELEVTAGTPATGSFTVSSPGSFEVESHHLEKTIVILNVR
jgi:hypothetical protein